MVIGDFNFITAAVISLGVRYPSLFASSYLNILPISDKSSFCEGNSTKGAVASMVQTHTSFSMVAPDWTSFSIKSWQNYLSPAGICST